MSSELNVIDQGPYFQFAPEVDFVKLPAGTYQPSYVSSGEFVLYKAGSFCAPNIDDNDVEYDWVNDAYFPMEEYNSGLIDLDNSINQFINSREFYLENQIDYRRSALLFGPPGTGKTQYINHKSNELVEKEDAIVIRIDSFTELECLCEDGIRTLARNIHDRLKVIIVEELNSFVKNESYHVYLTNMLDNLSLRQNVIIFATTNYPEDLPENFVDRPSRLDLLVPVYHTENDISYLPKWYEHLMGEKFPASLNDQWIRDAHKELSPAYFKELFIYSKVVNLPLEDSYNRLKKRRQLVRSGFNYEQDQVGFGINLNGEL